MRRAWSPRRSAPPAPPALIGPILVRGDSAYGNRAVVTACLRAGAEFSLVMTRNPAIDRAIAAIDEARVDPVSISRRGP